MATLLLWLHMPLRPRTARPTGSTVRIDGSVGPKHDMCISGLGQKSRADKTLPIDSYVYSMPESSTTRRTHTAHAYASMCGVVVDSAVAASQHQQHRNRGISAPAASNEPTLCKVIGGRDLHDNRIRRSADNRKNV